MCFTSTYIKHILMKLKPLTCGYGLINFPTDQNNFTSKIV